MLSNLLKILRIPTLSRCHTQNMSKLPRVLSENRPVVAQKRCFCQFTHKNFLIKDIRAQTRYYSNPLPPSNNLDEVLVDSNTYEIVCNETLEALSDYFDEVLESNPALKDADIIYGVSFLVNEHIFFQF